jgi:hypothetical protein
VLIGGVVDWGRNPDRMIACVDAAFEQLVDWTFTVDARAATSYVVETAIVPVTLGPDNLLGLAPGTTPTTRGPHGDSHADAAGYAHDHDRAPLRRSR